MTTTTLRCSETDCGATVAREYRGYLCPTCGNLLQAVNDPGPVPAERLKGLWKERRTSNHKPTTPAGSGVSASSSRIRRKRMWLRCSKAMSRCCPA